MKLQFKQDDLFRITNGNNFIEVKPSFKNGLESLKFYDGFEISCIIKRKAKGTYEDTKNKKIRHYYNFYLQFENGVRIQVRGNDKQSRIVLDDLSKYEG